MSWGSTQQQTAAVTVLLAGPVDRVNAWYQALVADARFRVVSFATDAGDLAQKLQMNPEVLVVYAGIFSGPSPLVDALTRLRHTAAYVILPAEVDEEAVKVVEGVQAVKGAWRGDVNLAELTGKMYADALAVREARTASVPFAAPSAGPQAPGLIAGLRVISVWNTAGGVGKTTVASNLAYALARRGLPTLLIGLSAPDDLPLILGLTVEPNIVNWMVAPSQESLGQAVQKVDKLDVLAGWPDMLSRAATAGGEGATIANLVVTAAYASYAAIVLDVPPTEWAAEAISASNTLLLVARPELADTWRTVDAYRTVTERMAGQHRIPPEGVYLVLNQARSGSIRPDDFHRACSDALGRTFPPVVITIPEDPRIVDAQNARQIPFLQVDALARSMMTLAEALFGAVGGAGQPQPKKRSGFRIRLGRRK